MEVLAVASECAPFVKTGGLADVMGALPKALKATGDHMKVLIPAYQALGELLSSGHMVHEFRDFFGGDATLVETNASGIDLLLLDAPHLYDRPGNIYLGADSKDWPDNALRFAALSYAGALIASEGLGKWAPDIVHIHDWQAGLLPVYLKQLNKRIPPIVCTVHNIAFQGNFAASQLTSLGLSSEHFTQDGFEYYGKISFLKAGLAFCDAITTVSPSYASELLTSEYGMGFEGLFQARKKDLHGILNGIDLDVWNPETDPNLKRNYSVRSPRRKAANRSELLSRYKLEPFDGPLFCVVSRLTVQKGLDLLLECIPDLISGGGKLAILGTGDRELERAFLQAGHDHSGSIGVIIGYNEELSHLLQGGSDAIVIPSRFEPCGLTQLYGLRYGTLPVVARTGGLADTIIDANEAGLATNCSTGFQFAPVNAALLGRAILRACEAYRNPAIWTGMMRRAMRHPVGWDVSAQAYHGLYTRLATK